jgi:type I restriction enzyme, S subunit
MELRAGFKQTDVGLIPEDWEVKPLRDVLSKGRLGGNYPNELIASNFPLMKMGNLGRGGFDISKVEYVCSGVTPDEQHRLAYGDVIFNTRNTLDLVGKVGIWRDELPVAYYNSNLMRFEFDSQVICSAEYANYALNTSDSISRLRALATGTTSVAAIYTRDLMELEVIVPTMAEQTVIAKALSDVDALIAGLEKLIAKKRDLKQAAMQQLLTGQTRLPGFSGEWAVKRLGDVGECLRGVSYKGDADLFPHDTDRSKRLLRSNNVQESLVVTSDLQYVKVDRVREHQVIREGDILICMANGSKALVGKAGYFQINDGFEYTFGAFMGAYRGNEQANRRFVFYLFQTNRYRDYITNLLAGSSINNLSPSSIESLEFNFPALDEQDAIAQALRDMDGELASLESRLAKTHTIKQGMMQELLTGKTRLV